MFQLRPHCPIGDLDARFDEAVEARENLRDTDKKETRLFVQTHPDVLVIPPDPPQMMIKVDQVRRVIETIYYRPGEARERVYIFTESSFMKEAANSLLKVLEEPPEFATIFLLDRKSGRTAAYDPLPLMIVTLGRVARRGNRTGSCQSSARLDSQQRALAARLSNGAIGAARSFDLAGYTAARAQALTILRTALRGADHSELFKATETYRAGAEGREKIEKLLRTLYSLLQDLAFLNSSTPDLVRNTDIQSELRKLAESADFDWIAFAADRLNEVERGMRRNLLRSLSLDAFAMALERV